MSIFRNWGLWRQLKLQHHRDHWACDPLKSTLCPSTAKSVLTVWQHLPTCYQSLVCRKICEWKDRGLPGESWSCPSKRITCKLSRAGTCSSKSRQQNRLADMESVYRLCRQYKGRQQPPMSQNDPRWIACHRHFCSNSAQRRSEIAWGPFDCLFTGLARETFVDARPSSCIDHRLDSEEKEKS